MAPGEGVNWAGINVPSPLGLGNQTTSLELSMLFEYPSAIRAASTKNPRCLDMMVGSVEYEN